MGRRFASFAMRRQVRDHAGRGGSPLGPLTNRLALHLQSDFGVTVISGKVSEWAGQEGYRNTVVQATDANRPALVPNVLDGHPAIRFNGTQWLQSLAQVGVVAGDSPRVYVVGSFAATGTSYAGTLASYDNGAVINRGFISFHNVADQGFNALRGGFLRQVSVTTALGNNSIPHLFDGRNDPTACVLAINGIDRGSFPAAGGLDFTPDNINIGRTPSGVLALTGDIFCVIVANNETASSHTTIMNYLAGQYPSLGLGTPKGILGPLLHADFDAADPGIVLNAGNVASIPNRGTDTAAMVQATAANQPAFSATSFAGGPGMTFDGVNDTMACTFTTPIPSGRRPYMWLAFKALNTNTTDQVIGILDAASRYFVGWSNRVAGAQTQGAVTPGAAGIGASPNLGAAETVNTHLLEVGNTVNGTAAFVLDGIVSNGLAAPPFVPTDAPLPVLRAASYQAGSQFGNCIVRRIIVANDMPSQAQIDAMRAYLRAQPYGLTF